MKLLKNKQDKFNDLKEEVEKLKIQKLADEEYRLLKEEYNQLKYGDIKTKGVKLGNTLSHGGSVLADMFKWAIKDDSRLEVKRIINPMIINLFKDLETIKIQETDRELVLDSREYTKLKARYYPK